MKYLFVLALLFCAYPLSAQVVDANACDILANPSSFDGKIVRIKGTVIAGFEEFSIKPSGCPQSNGSIWLDYPEGTKAKAGLAALLKFQLAQNNPASPSSPSRPSLKLEKNKDFKQFDSLLSTPAHTNGICLACVRYTVNATLVGRLDAAKEAGVVRDKDGKFVAVNGFGNLNRYTTRLVLQSVSEVSPQEIDYSKNAVPGKSDSQESQGVDPVAAAHQTASAFPANSTAANQVERAAAAFGKEGDDNGVEVGFGSANEVSKGEGGKGNHNSPDGLLFNCVFDADRLKGEALTITISHIGTHIADIRDPHQASNGHNFLQLEDRAWETSVLTAIGNRKKTLTLPGGYLVWNAAWPEADRSKMVDQGIGKFLSEWDSLDSIAK